VFVCALQLCALVNLFAGLFILHLKHFGEVFLCASSAGIYSPFKRETKVRAHVCVCDLSCQLIVFV